MMYESTTYINTSEKNGKNPTLESLKNTETPLKSMTILGFFTSSDPDADHRTIHRVALTASTFSWHLTALGIWWIQSHPYSFFLHLTKSAYPVGFKMETNMVCAFFFPFQGMMVRFRVRSAKVMSIRVTRSQCQKMCLFHQDPNTCYQYEVTKMVVLAKSRKSENNGFLVLNHKLETSKTSVFVVCRFLIFCVSAKSASKNAVFFHVHESEEKGEHVCSTNKATASQWQRLSQRKCLFYVQIGNILGFYALLTPEGHN